MSGEVRFAFYSAVTGSTLTASSIGSGSIETYHLSASAVTPAKADLTQTWNFASGTLRAGTAVGSSDVVIKSQFDAALAAVTASEGPTPVKGSVRLRFPLDDELLGFFLYDNGAKTLTTAQNMTVNGGNFGAITDFAVGQKILFAVKEDAAAFAASGSWGGIYDITATGSNDPGGSPAVFTRAANFDSDADVLSGSFVFALATNNLPDPQPAFVYLATTGSVTLGTTPLRFPILSGSGGTFNGNAAKGSVRSVLIGDDETTGFFQYSSGTLTFQGHANLNDFGIGGNSDYTTGDRLLFTIPQNAACFAASGSWSGIYTITNVGANDPSGSAPVLTRATDFDATSEIFPGSFVFANSGNPNTDGPEIWYLATSGSVTLDSTPLLFASASFSVTGSGGGGTTYSGSPTIEITSGSIAVKNFSIGPGHLSGTVVYASGGLSLDPGNGLSVNASGALGIDTGTNSVYIRPNGITAGHLSSSVVYNGGVGEPLSLDPGGLRIGNIGPAYLSSSVAGNGLGGGGGPALFVNVDPVSQNPLVVSVSGTSVREASATQSGYMTTASFQQLASVVSYSSPPVTAGPIGTAVTTSNTQTAAFNIGVVPANTIWTVKFTSFSIDTAEAANLINNVGAFSIYRSGSNNVTQVGATEIEHSFVSGAFTSVTMSLGLAQGQPGNADFVIQGINTYNIKHWAKFQITEFVYA